MFSSNSDRDNNSMSLKYNWLYKGSEWTITSLSSSISLNAILINNDGSLNLKQNYANNIRPTFYLKSNVKITGGEGTFDNPYIIGM